MQIFWQRQLNAARPRANVYDCVRAGEKERQEIEEGRGVWNVCMCVVRVCACLVCVYFNAVEWSYLIGARLLLDFLFIFLFPRFFPIDLLWRKVIFLFPACCVCDSSLICLCDFIKYLSSSVVVKSPAMTRPFACRKEGGEREEHKRG